MNWKERFAGKKEGLTAEEQALLDVYAQLRDIESSVSATALRIREELIWRMRDRLYGNGFVAALSRVFGGSFAKSESAQLYRAENWSCSRRSLSMKNARRRIADLVRVTKLACAACQSTLSTIR
jgi:hypothetical protein